MDSLIETFHLDWQAVVAQLINFIVVAAVLWFFALKPLLKIMTERTTKIEKSLAQAQEIEKNLASTKTDYEQAIKTAKQEAHEILEQAQKQSELNKTEAVKNARAEVEKVVVEGKRQLAADRATIVKEIKNEVSELVIAATGKVLAGVIDKKIDEKIIRQALDEVK